MTPLSFSRRQMIREATLTEADLAQIAQCRRDHNRLGFAYQIGFVRLFSRFPDQQPLEIYDELLSFVRGLPAELGAVMLVGHNPGLEELARALVPEGRAFPTCTLATITFKADKWSAVGAGKGRLAAFLTPADFA